MIERHDAGPRSFARGVTRPAGPERERVAFVLSGGGVLGSIQVGQLCALIEAGIVPDLMIAASVGALNAVAVAANPSSEGTEHLRSVWARLKTEDIFPGSPMQRAWHFVRKGDHLYPNSGIRRLVDLVGRRSFEELAVPTHVVAANLRSGKEHWFTEGPLAPAVLASTALPGIFPPVLVDGELYVDGGVVNNVPVGKAVQLGATRVFVLTCGTPPYAARPIRRPLDVLMQAVVRSRAAQVEGDIARYGARTRIEVLPVPETGPIRFTDPTHSAQLIEASRAATHAHLARALSRAPL